jgi:hypothetical protein
MIPLKWLSRLLFSKKPESAEHIILPMKEQVGAWHSACKKMKWDISEKEFDGIDSSLLLTESDLEQGFVGTALFYGFGNDGTGHADSVFSGKMAWDYACKRSGNKVWQSPHINFDRPDSFRLRPGAPPRPKGFYFGKIQIGEGFRGMTASQSRKRFNTVTGFGPEGFQLVCITHTRFPDLMSERKIPFMALADYDVAPHGFNDFFDIPQLFSSNRILGLGIGNIDYNYPGFVIPVMIIQPKGS